MVSLHMNYQMFSSNCLLGIAINPKTKYKLGYVYCCFTFMEKLLTRKYVITEDL
jgi:hypothetical protein